MKQEEGFAWKERRKAITKIMSHEIWENRNLRAVVWQVTLTVNGKGRERRKRKWR